MTDTNLDINKKYKSTIAQQFARTLREVGVRLVFGVPSGNMIDYIEALRLEDGIDFVLVGHETTAAMQPNNS